MYALQQVKNGQRIGKVWIFASRKLAQESVILTYQVTDSDSLLESSIHVSPSLIQVSTNYTGTIYYTISEVIASDMPLVLD